MSKVEKSECWNGCSKPSLVTYGQLSDMVNDALEEELLEI
jgi:hypothetical protein